MKDDCQSACKTALDEMHMQGVFASLVQGRFGPHACMTGVAVQHLQRRLIRYTAQLFDADQAKTFEWRIIGKIYGSPRQMQRGFQGMKQLWTNGFSHRDEEGSKIPEPIHCLPDLCLVLMTEAQGVPLRHYIKDLLATPSHMRRVAEAIATLHLSPAIGNRPFTIEDQLLHCRPSPLALAQAYPELASAIHYIVETAKAIEKSFGSDIFTLIHGDLHLGNLLIDHENVWLLDFDKLNYADPAYDLAETFVFLKRTAEKRRIAAYVAVLRDAFIAHYFSIMGWEIAGRVPLYEGLLHLKRACSCFRAQDESGWEEKTKALITQSVACMQMMESDRGKLGFNEVIELYHRCPGST